MPENELQFIEDPTQGSTAFIQNDVPQLSDGDYRLSATLTATGEGIDDQQSFALDFSVQGPRFSIDPNDVQGVFPAAKSVGDFSTVLPHVMLKRSTLPWERSPILDGNITPASSWLGLLVMDEEEMESNQVSVANVTRDQLNATTYPNESGEDPDAMVNTIGMQTSFFEQICSNFLDLPWLAHVRRSFDKEDIQLPGDLSVVVANRLPKAGSHTHVFLVTLENAFAASGSLALEEASPGMVELPVLLSWDFTVSEENEGAEFANSLSNLTVANLIKILPDNPAASYTNEAGYVVLPHQLRTGGNTASFYRGPLMVPQTTMDVTLPTLTADSLLAYDANVGMFVSSYAAAWELGRLLAMANKTYRTNLYRWKRSRTLLNKANTQALEKAHLPVYGKTKTWQALNDSEVAYFRLNQNTESNLASNHDNFSISKEGKVKFRTNPTFGDSLSFDGETTWVNANSVCDAIADTASLSLWFRVQHFAQTEVAATDANIRIIAAWEEQNYSSAIVQVCLSGNKLALYTSNGISTSSLSVEEGIWYHIVLKQTVQDDDLEVELWVDGSLLVSKTVPNRQNINYDYLSLSTIQASGGHYFFGQMANLRVYNRLLNESEIGLIREADQQGAVLYPFLNPLRRLEGVPFNYLLPDEELLPRESIAFAAVDQTWLACLLDGAFSIGRSSQARLVEDEVILSELGLNTEVTYSAMMIRSATLATWPEVVIEGYDEILGVNDVGDDDNRLPVVRKVLLSDSFLLCLFEGTVQTVDVSQKSKALHFGVESTESGYEVSLRDANGNEDGSAPVDFRNDDRVMNMGVTAENITLSLTSQFDDFTSAQFAFEMIEGVQRVRFTNT